MQYDMLVINYNTSKLTNACIQSILNKDDRCLAAVYVLDNSDKEQFKTVAYDAKVHVIDNFNGKLFKKSDIIEQYGKTLTDTQHGSMHHAFSVDWFMYAGISRPNLVIIDSDAILKRSIDFIDKNVCTAAEIQDSSIYWKDKAAAIRFMPVLQYLNLKMLCAHRIRYFDPCRIHGGAYSQKLYDTGGSFLEDVVAAGLPYKLIRCSTYADHLVNGSWKTQQVDKFIEDRKEYM